MTTLIGGPLDGRQHRIPAHLVPKAPSVCTRPPGGVWQHYARGDDGRYRFAGECTGVHPERPPYEIPDECCCGDPNCRDGEERIARWVRELRRHDR